MQKITVQVLLLLLTSPVLAQELTLFEPVETQATEEKPALGPGGPVNQNGLPAYTLRSSTRIGDSYAVELADRQGKITKVQWKPGSRAAIPGAGGFSIEDIQQRNVIIAQPGNDPCVTSAAKGVSCLDASRSRLSLALAAPLAPTAQGPQQQKAGPNGAPNAAAAQNPFEAAIQAQQAQAAQGQQQGGQGFFVNPFSGKAEVVNQPSPAEQTARDARQRARAERLNQADPARIPDNQVPDGMRRVTTPFGDRLVPGR